MADKYLQGLTELTTPAMEDLLMTVDDPSSSPTSKKITLTNLFAGVPTTTTFTPTVTLVGGGGNVTPVYTVNTGRYCRVGSRVFADVELSGDGGSEGAGTGLINVALPVAAGASGKFNYIPCGSLVNDTDEYIIAGLIQATESTMTIYYQDAAGNRSGADGADQSNASRAIYLSFNYEV